MLIVGASGRIARLDSDGRLDPTFGAAGVAEITVVGGTLLGGDIDSAGRIVVTGSLYELGSPGPTAQEYGAVRLLADGSLDPAFSGDGLMELDAASGVHVLHAVRAAGSDGAMLAVAEKAGSGYFPDHGLIRITADGAIDETYGGGFAQLVRGSWPGDAVRFVADFAVDSAGRAVAAVQGDSYGGPTVLRLDAAGDPDPSFFGYTSYLPGYFVWNSFAASKVAFDGAGRIVGLERPEFLRRLEDGAPDATFSGDGYAWHVATGFAGFIGFPGNVALAARNGRELLDYVGAICAYELMDPISDGRECGGEEFLAVATRADRWALAKLVEYRNAKGRVVARGIGVQAIDPAAPGAIVSTTYRTRDVSFSRLAGLVISPDGATAYALADTFVLRVDLASPKPAPLPDLRVNWLGYPRAIDLGGGRYHVTARVRIRNVSRRDAEYTIGLVGFGDGKFDVALAPFESAPNSEPFRLRARSSVVKRFTWEGGDIKTDLAGARLGIQVSCELPDANFADNTASSLPITPVYAPR